MDRLRDGVALAIELDDFRSSHFSGIDGSIGVDSQRRSDRRDPLSVGPCAHRSYPRDAAAHRGAEVVVVAGGEYAATIVHPRRERGELRVAGRERERQVDVAVWASIVARLEAEAPDLVVVV